MLLFTVVIQQQKPGDRKALEAKYDDYLVRFPNGKLKDWALYQKGALALGDENLDEAESYFMQIKNRNKEDKAVNMAQRGLERISKKRALKK